LAQRVLTYRPEKGKIEENPPLAQHQDGLRRCAV
jgi:hypothetical protein